VHTTCDSSANLAAAVTDETGTGSVVFSTSPTLTTPNLGTPSAVTLTNATGLPVSTGISGLATGVATFLATPSSSNLATAVTDETGSGSLVFGTSPTLGGNVVISSNSASAALRITQTGSGNALLVEDEASTDSTPFVVNTDGNVGIGTSPLVPGLTVAANANSWVNTRAFAGIPLFAGYRASGTISSPTIVASGDEAARFDVRGYDGASYVQAATISFAIDGTPGTSDMPGRLVFSTTADGAATPTERMRITSAGFVGVNTSSPSAVLNVVGHNEFALGLTAQTSSNQTAFLSHPVAILANTSSAAGNGAGLRYSIADTGGVARTAGGIGTVATAKGASSVTADMYFYTGTTPTERMRIDSAGNVGIGASPSEALTVTRSTGETVIGIRNTGTASSWLTLAPSSSGSAYIHNVGNTPTIFTTNGTEKMRITNTGNLLLGTSASPTTGDQCLTIETGTAPTATPADTISVYSSDLSAGNTMLSIYTEGTSVNANTTAAATHRIAVRINGTVYYLLANTSA